MSVVSEYRTSCITVFEFSMAFLLSSSRLRLLLAIALFGINWPALALVTTSRVVCMDINSERGDKSSPSEQIIDGMIVESKPLGPVVGVTISFVNLILHEQAVRSKLRSRAKLLFSLIESRGLLGFEQGLEFLEANPANYGCPGYQVAGVIEFLHNER